MGKFVASNKPLCTQPDKLNIRVQYTWKYLYNFQVEPAYCTDISLEKYLCCSQSRYNKLVSKELQEANNRLSLSFSLSFSLSVSHTLASPTPRHPPPPPSTHYTPAWEGVGGVRRSGHYYCVSSFRPLVASGEILMAGPVLRSNQRTRRERCIALRALTWNTQSSVIFLILSVCCNRGNKIC